MLLEGGDKERGRLLLEAILSQMRHEIERGGRHEMWYRKSHSIALALAGRNNEAIAMLQRVLASNAGWTDAWLFFEVEPAYDVLREDPRFIELLSAVRAQAQRNAASLSGCVQRDSFRTGGRDQDESPADPHGRRGRLS